MEVEPTNEPTILPEFMWLWIAFCFLSARRLVIQGSSQSIQVSEMEAYHRFRGLPGGWLKQVYIEVIDAMDSKYLEIIRKQIERENSRRAQQGAGQAPRRRVR